MKTSEIKPGDIIQLTHNCEVASVQPGVLHVKDKERGINGINFKIVGAPLISSTKSGSFFNVTKKVTKTELAELLTKSHGAPLTVEYTKQDGEARVLRGYWVGIDDQMGRSYCVDLDVVEEHKVRLVDHRTIQSLILNGTQYLLK